jgi:hypothetical protein
VNVIRVVDRRSVVIDATCGEQSDGVRGGGGLEDGAAVGWPPSVLVVHRFGGRVVDRDVGAGLVVL